MNSVHMTYTLTIILHEVLYKLNVTQRWYKLFEEEILATYWQLIKDKNGPSDMSQQIEVKETGDGLIWLRTVRSSCFIIDR